MDLREQLHDADRRLIRGVDALDDAGWAEPSLLPGWSRAHVVAHLALNAEALSTVLRGATAGVAVTMYPSAQARDDDIAALAQAEPSDLRTRLLGATTALGSAIDTLPADRYGVRVERTPGSGRSFDVGHVTAMRLREVEIHHVDLDAGVTVADWTLDFAAHLLDVLAASRADAAACVIEAVDLHRRWTLGEPGVGPVVRGTAADLGWWLSGRGDGARLTSDRGDLPLIPDW